MNIAINEGLIYKRELKELEVGTNLHTTEEVPPHSVAGAGENSPNRDQTIRSTVGNTEIGIPPEVEARGPPTRTLRRS